MSDVRSRLESALEHAPDFDGYELEWRPGSYWAQPLKALLATVRAEHLRRYAKRQAASGVLAAEGTLGAEVDGSLQRALEATHPSFMGGAYLPEFLPWEVEIARATMNSTTRDVVSLRARPDGQGIAYRMVDEYGEESGRFVLAIERSSEPLTLGEVLLQVAEATHTGWECGLLGLRTMNGDEADFLEFDSEYYVELSAFFEEEEALWQASLRGE